MSDAPDVSAQLAQPTLAQIDRACGHLITPQDEPVHLDRLLTGEETPIIPPEGAAPLVALWAPGTEVPAPFVQQVAAQLGQAWYAQVLQSSHRAARRGMYYAERCAVDGILKQQDATASSLARVVSRYDPADYHRVWHAMPLTDALTYLMMRSVDHISRNLNDYL